MLDSRYIYMMPSHVGKVLADEATGTRVLRSFGNFVKGCFDSIGIVWETKEYVDLFYKDKSLKYCY